MIKFLFWVGVGIYVVPLAEKYVYSLTIDRRT